MSEPLDDELMSKVMRSVRIEPRQPMRIKIAKFLGGKETDTHIFEVSVGSEIKDIQKEVGQVVLRWKGGFPVGARYVVERLLD